MSTGVVAKVLRQVAGDGATVLWLPSCASTQDEAVAALAGGAGTVLVGTGHQTAGRGRQGRSWTDAPDAAVLLSVARAASWPTTFLESLSQRAAHDVVEQLAAAYPTLGGALTVDPPNDIIAGTEGAKVAGVLVDTLVVGDEVRRVVIGYGVNVLDVPAEARAQRRVAALQQFAPITLQQAWTAVATAALTTLRVP